MLTACHTACTTACLSACFTWCTTCETAYFLFSPSAASSFNSELWSFLSEFPQFSVLSLVCFAFVSRRFWPHRLIWPSGSRRAVHSSRRSSVVRCQSSVIMECQSIRLVGQAKIVVYGLMYGNTHCGRSKRALPSFCQSVCLSLSLSPFFPLSLSLSLLPCVTV